MQHFEIMALDQDGVCVSRHIVSAAEAEAAQLDIAGRRPDHAIVVRPLDNPRAYTPGGPVSGAHVLAKRERVKAWDDFISK